MIIKYPSELPSPHFKSKIQRQKNFVSTDMQSGDSRLRRRFKNVPSFVQVLWRLTAAEAAVFEGWVEHALEGGVNWFEINMRTPSGIQLVQAQFVNHPLENETPKGASWVYVAKLKIKSRITPSEQNTVTGVLSPNTADDFVSGVSDALDSYQE